MKNRKKCGIIKIGNPKIASERECKTMKAPRESKVRENIVIVTMLVDTCALVKYLFWDFMLGKANITVTDMPVCCNCIFG